MDGTKITRQRDGWMECDMVVTEITRPGTDSKNITRQRDARMKSYMVGTEELNGCYEHNSPKGGMAQK